MKLKRRRRYPFVPLYSMSDLAFLLLIFIMLVSLINSGAAADIQHALAQSAEPVHAERNLEIWIDRYGGLYFEGMPSTLTAIEQGIAENAAAPIPRLHIVADRDTPFQTVHTVLEIVQNFEHPLVSFVVRHE